MTDRDELAALIHEVSEAHYMEEDRTGRYRCSCGNPNPLHDNQAMAQAILARWRLVPVVPSWDDAPPNGYTHSGTPSWSPRIAFPHETPLPCYEDDINRCGCSTCINEPKIPGKRPVTEAAQHRAASELTQHDIDADIYDYHHHDAPMNLNGLHDDQALVTYVTGCACGRTDNHGPHED